MVYLSDFSQYVFLGTDEVFEGSLIGIDQFDHNLVWTYLPFGKLITCSFNHQKACINL